MRLGSKKVSRPLSHVPSPTCSVFEEYVLLPGSASPEPVILIVLVVCDAIPYLWNVGVIAGDLSRSPFRGMYHAMKLGLE